MIIESLLDTDLYKFTMMQVVLHKFPAAMAEYRFKCRSPHIDLRPFAKEILHEIDHYCSLHMQKDELSYLRTLAFIKSDFVEFLRIFKPYKDFITVKTDPEFEIIIKGPWLHTILFEVPVLAIISEVYFRHEKNKIDLEDGRRRTLEKIKMVQEKKDNHAFKFSDFGTRRRYSREWQFEAVETLCRALPNNMTGTSNVFLAKELQVKPIGTMAHEYIQACQSLGPRLLYSQKFAFEMWAQEYRGDLGIALSDTYSLDAFIKDFDLYFCKLFDGARQDSGDPYEWGDRIIEHYKEMRIDPKTKTLVFSDALTMTKALAIFDYFKDRTNPVFGIGTHLTHDVGVKPIDMVIKMVECNGQPVAKISDEPSKTMCRDESYLSYLRQVFQIKG